MTATTIMLSTLVAFFAIAFAFAIVALVKSKVDRLRSEFAALAAEKLEEKASDLSAKNAADVKPLFDALRANIDDFKKVAESAKDANIKLGSELNTKIDEVGRRAQSLGKQADDFVTALRGGNKNQGNWGEGIVRNILESAGLRAGEDFLEQSGASGAGLPDFIVKYGEHKKVIIDAKVNIDSFLAALQAANEGRNADADALMKAHAKSVRTQITGLAAKKYPVKLKERELDAEAEYSPVVIMAMPSEATYAAALSADPGIGAFANANNIVLASPQMLFGYLVLFKLVIDRVKVDRNNHDIAKRASQLLSRMDAAYKALEGIGASLGKAQEQYHEAMKKLGGEEGGLSILVPAKELAKLANITDRYVSAAMQS